MFPENSHPLSGIEAELTCFETIFQHFSWSLPFFSLLFFLFFFFLINYLAEADVGMTKKMTMMWQCIGMNTVTSHKVSLSVLSPCQNCVVRFFLWFVCVCEVPPDSPFFYATRKKADQSLFLPFYKDADDHVSWWLCVKFQDTSYWYLINNKERKLLKYTCNTCVVNSCLTCGVNTGFTQPPVEYTMGHVSVTNQSRYCPVLVYHKMVRELDSDTSTRWSGTDSGRQTLSRHLWVVWLPNKHLDGQETVREHPDGLKPEFLTILRLLGCLWILLLTWSMKG